MIGRIPAVAALAAFGCALLVTSRAADPVAQFEQEVRPLLKDHCVECHGPEKQKGGLRLDQKASVFRAANSEAVPVVPGNATASEVVKRVGSADPDEMMPPKGKRLSPEEIASIKQWIESGAHWSEGGAQEKDAPAQVVAITEIDRA